MRVLWKSEPAPEVPTEDDSITTPVYVPRGQIDTISTGTANSQQHRVTHARDTVRIHPESAGVTVNLDDGSGFGYNFPYPCDRVELKVRRKGKYDWLMVLETVSAQFDSTLEIRFPKQWYDLPPGYYEVKITFHSGERENKGGWLLFYKDGAPSARTVDAHQIRFRPKPNAPIGHHIEEA